VSEVIPFSLKDAPALIERLLPVQKLSAESYKEQMAGSGKTLTALGSYWKGRKPLILNKACILGCLLPATNDDRRDLEIFEKLMAMDDESFAIRAKRRPKPKEILAKLSIGRIADYFDIEPPGVLPESSPIDWSNELLDGIRVGWREDLTPIDRLRLEAQMLPPVPYRQRVEDSNRAEEVAEVHEHIWEAVNTHLGTHAFTFPELVEQLGVMRFGRRPKVADTFCGSGQIPFEAARLGCDVFASDLNPVACMLTWGAFSIVGANSSERAALEAEQDALVKSVEAEIEGLGVESDGQGWRAKTFLYCVEAKCPQTGWLVPLLPSRIVSLQRSQCSRVAYAELVPDPVNLRYRILIHEVTSSIDLKALSKGTIRSDGQGSDPYMVHTVDGKEYRTKISTLRGDHRRADGATSNKLRLWSKSDCYPHPDDIYQERLYCIQWVKPKKKGKGLDYEFRSVTDPDIQREETVRNFVDEHLDEWQSKGWIPDMRIEAGAKTDEPIRTRGWTHWHHLFNPRQLLVAGTIRRHVTANQAFAFGRVINANARLSRWDPQSGGGGCVQGVFDSQALNTLLNYGCRSLESVLDQIAKNPKSFPLPDAERIVFTQNASTLDQPADIFITDPPYGDAVRYEEILEFFIAWFRKCPPIEFDKWTWDSRRALAVKGGGEEFRQGMVAAYKRMTECMSDNGIQVIMFTHQSGSIWADMANIVWASGLQVTAAWYVVTETDSALREGSYVKGTVLLVLRKRAGSHKISRDDLAWEIQEEVEEQVASLTGLNQQAKGLYRDENVFEDADIQMAGYAAALRVLTKYAIIDGRDMTAEASRPRVKGEKTFIDSLIEFAVATANQCLVPAGIEKPHWDKLSGAERFYLKMLDLEARGAKTLDNYQNFAKAFKVRDFNAFLESSKANSARLKSASEFGRAEMGESSEFYESVLRASLYAMMEIEKNIDGADVLAHLRLNVPNYYGDTTQRELVVELAGYMAKQLESIRPDEASAARVLRELVKNERLG
jgi:putative DNA methylase